MTTPEPIETIAFTPDYYDSSVHVPDALASACIRVFSGDDERYVTLALDVNGSTKVLAMEVCAAHAPAFIQGYLRGMEIGYAVAEEIAADEEYERSRKE
jgi:hypothetical protein